MTRIQTKRRNGIVPDDFEIDQNITVLRNRFGQATPMGKAVESDYLKGTVLRIVAMNLPYVLCEATDPLKGRATITVDVRDHTFARVSDEYADAVAACCCQCCEQDHSDAEEPAPEIPF